jgi:hypothetical protein
MDYLVTVECEVRVSVDNGGETAAIAVAQRHVANDWLLQHREGAAIDAGHFEVKGLSGLAMTARPWVGNRRVSKEGSDVADSD